MIMRRQHPETHSGSRVVAIADNDARSHHPTGPECQLCRRPIGYVLDPDEWVHRDHHQADHAAYPETFPRS
jgi:hypothetical protein